MARTLNGATAAILLLLLTASSSTAQKATEPFIPLGRSPGLSATQTYTGAIVAVDAAERTVSFGSAQDRHSIRVTRETRIWIDRTKYGLTNMTGSFEDLKPGRRAEVKYVDEGRREAADWIKVVPEGAD